MAVIYKGLGYPMWIDISKSEMDIRIMESVADIIIRWGSLTAFAQAVGCTPSIAHHWRLRDSIPAAWFAPVARAALAKGHLDITADRLADLAERKRLRRAHASVEGASA